MKAASVALLFVFLLPRASRSQSPFPTRIYEALAAIEQRLLSPIETDEYKAIEDAQQGLLTLRAERAGSVSEVNSDFTTSCQSERG
jgi:hypothetical protein